MDFSKVTRREFLQASSCGALAAATLPILGQVAGQPASKKIGFAFVGLGNLTMTQLLPGIAKSQNVRIAALVSGSPEKAKKLAAEYGVSEKSIYNYENFDSIKDNPDVDVVYIVLPNGMHAEYTIRAAKAGKHVLCEKPMANTVEECTQMIDACKAAGKKLMIAYRLRHEPHNQKAIQICRDQTYGPLRTIQSEFGFNVPGGKWRTDKKLAGGGPIPDIGVYCINAARYLTGTEPVQVSATIHQPQGDPRFKDVEESAAWWMRFPNGLMAHSAVTYGWFLSGRYHFATQESFVNMDAGFAYNGIRMSIANKGKTEQVKLPDVHQFAAEMEHFANCVLNDKPPITPGEDGLADVKVIRAIYQSAETGKAVDIT